ncbi:TIGR00282 family metallophosphoesterase [Parasphaerochaeta coccoides]|uniref:Metallophosphoesterase n=1 Tax=Parasphaerochaeta coccoides (strain ATCC BAA-1237 / DSM 17374 / SPN1) TaxID=760011 RepID=F4GJN7_PARC1|nr:TIGR00282 family metallophosphoesterase [Parasphaerochaeta coccoides]AEC02784.1 hypothetical protein Spico_1582 [Parasphaerochaeta coccoides DSM 17374]
MSIRILCLGEIVGRPGIHTVKSVVRNLRTEKNINLVIANGEGATNGFGLGKNHAIQLLKLGIDILTGGEKIYFKMDMVDYIERNSSILRPANYPMGTPGRGIRYVKLPGSGVTVAVITLLGTTDFPRTHLANPFALAASMVEKARQETPFVIMQFHASTTAEKNTMAFHLDGKVTAMVGTHSKVLTADARIFPQGTAMITDNGRCGSTMSVGGFAPDREIEKLITQIPVRSMECWDSLEAQGVLIEADDSGKAVSIETLRIPVATPEQHADTGASDEE